MAKTNFKSVDEYIRSHPKAVQSVLQRVRSVIRKAVPGAEEVISYQMPAYKLPVGASSLSLGGNSITRSMAPPVASSRRSRTTSHRTRSARARSASPSVSRSPRN